jgi:DNA-binding beta-propeller fold protein YncE
MHIPRTVAALVSAGALLITAAAPASSDDVVVDGLVSPLGFAVGSDGTIYVGEAFIGQLTAVRGESRQVVATAGDGSFISGVAALGRGNVSYTASLPPEFADGPPLDTTLNSLLPNGRTAVLGSLRDYEIANNPDAGNSYGFVDADADCLAQLPPDFQPYSGAIDSNPYKVAIDSDGSRLVADAAGNSIIRIAPNGKRIGTVAILPPIPQGPIDADLAGEFGLPDCLLGEFYASEPVATDIEIGPDGDYFVSALPGGPELPTFGRVFRIDRETGSVQTYATGFSGSTDIAVAADGTVYVAELFGFQVSRIDPGDDTASESAFVECPSAVEFGHNGELLVAKAGICSDEPAPGSIIRLDL